MKTVQKAFQLKLDISPLDYSILHNVKSSIIIAYKVEKVKRKSATSDAFALFVALNC